MSTKIEGAGAIPLVSSITVEKLPSSGGDVYLVTTRHMRRVIRNWAAVLDIFCQSVGVVDTWAKDTDARL